VLTAGGVPGGRPPLPAPQLNPSTAFGTVLVDELVRCGLREAVLAPGSRSAPLAMALHEADRQGRLRLHVRIDERSASFLALGLAKASRRPVAVLCTSGTAAAHLHAAVLEADESAVPLLVFTADRPPELRGTGANQAVDQVKLYGSAVRWYCEAGVPERRIGQVAYWRSMTCRAWAAAAGGAGGLAGPVHVNLPLREPLVPGLPDAGLGADLDLTWPEPLDGRSDGAPWTVASQVPAAGPVVELDWTERGVVVCGDGDYDAGQLLALAEAAGWPVLAEPSANARRGPCAIAGYGYLLDSAEFTAAHRPDVIISAGRPGLSRGQLAFLRGLPAAPPPRHVLVAQGSGRWADPARTGTEVAATVRLTGAPPAGPVGSGWLRSWLDADAVVRQAVAKVLGDELTEPSLARALPAALPDGALLWAASSLPVRDLDRQMAPRTGLRVLASRGASGIDGLVSAATGAALAHQAAGGGPAAALLGDLAVLHDAPGLFLGPDEPRPDLCLVVANNDGGGIFSGLEQAAFPGSFERVFGTPHGASLDRLAAAAGLAYRLVTSLAELPAVLAEPGLRLAEVRASREDSTALRAEAGRAGAEMLRQQLR
jgi:2-succinyl-5-enolpyruvyl-6-hydroxy-3-cyclohexene-1-carboxylate synthase